ncbi:TetR/AcrR family transcriptional regulator [Rhodococcus aetherivorans]|uniref:TetR/AcrR family transcriptional regulator n=1 Tax=Rhodococcus aetherivorans TaxID=191292 RepID=UPI0005C85663|nr:TetR/AcrR family transcriptional regulator [Rhodococcus aetherivorans]
MATLVTRDEYFAAALEILSTDGYGKLKLAPVCKLLKVTTGSFYNYFASWQDFKTEFLQAWLKGRTLQLVDLAQTEAEPVRRLEILLDFAAGLPHRAESAIRAWSHSDAEVAAIQAVVDAQRFKVVYGAMSTVLADAEDAERYAYLGLYILIGFQQLEPPQDVEHLRWSLRQLILEVGQALPQ